MSLPKHPRTIVFGSDEIQDRLDSKLGHCLYIYWPKDNAGEPVAGDVVEVVQAEGVFLTDTMVTTPPGQVMWCQPHKRWRWQVVKTERASRGEFGPSDHLLVLVR